MWQQSQEKKNVYYQAQTMKEVGLLRTRIDLFGGRWIHSQNGFPCLNNKSNERRLKGKPLDLERGGRWWLGSRVEVRLSSQSVWQIVTQISWARLLVQPTLGIDQCWLAKQKRTSLCLSTHQYFLLCYEMSFCHWSIGVTWHNPWLWLVRGKVVARQAGDNKINEMERLCSIIAVTNAPAPPSTAQCMVTACTRNVMCVTFVAKLSTS